MNRTAEISECGLFRWWLERRWEEGGSIVCFVMLNPSIADAERDDNTVRKCVKFAKAWGFSAMTVRNLYPFRATKPQDLKKWMKSLDVTGGERGEEELRAATTADLVVAAWGLNATNNAAKRFCDIAYPSPIWCINLTIEGIPTHPLYQLDRSQPKPFCRCEGLDWKPKKVA